MTKQITLHQFETIDGLYNELTRMGDFLTSADPRAWISLSNRLDAAVIDAIGYDAAMAFESAEAAAADLICRALTSSTLVFDGEAA